MFCPRQDKGVQDAILNLVGDGGVFRVARIDTDVHQGNGEPQQNRL
jgi:acetoin utilization deacetylase AcuC-like enzyme